MAKLLRFNTEDQELLGILVTPSTKLVVQSKGEDVIIKHEGSVYVLDSSTYDLEMVLQMIDAAAIQL